MNRFGMFFLCFFAINILITILGIVVLWWIPIRLIAIIRKLSNYKNDIPQYYLLYFNYTECNEYSSFCRHNFFNITAIHFSLYIPWWFEILILHNKFIFFVHLSDKRIEKACDIINEKQYDQRGGERQSVIDTWGMWEIFLVFKGKTM